MDDYISREAAVKRINSCIFTAQDAWESGYNTAMAEIMERIKHIPTADVQPVKHGHWVNEGFLDMHCSNCGETPDSESGSCPTPTDFCPYCGVRMDGDSE